jgi:hypothetical protein
MKGEENFIVDLLSWAGNVGGSEHPLTFDNPSDEELTQGYHSYLPRMIPQSFHPPCPALFYLG